MLTNMFYLQKFQHKAVALFSVLAVRNTDLVLSVFTSTPFVVTPFDYIICFNLKKLFYVCCLCHWCKLSGREQEDHLTNVSGNVTGDWCKQQITDAVEYVFLEHQFLSRPLKDWKKKWGEKKPVSITHSQFNTTMWQYIKWKQDIPVKISMCI